MVSTSSDEAFEQLTDLAMRYPQVWEMNGPLTEDIVKAAEDRLGLTFPRSYRLFLLRQGFASFVGGGVNGIHPNSTSDNLVGSLFLDTEKAWERGWIPKDCLFIENMDEVYILLDMSQMLAAEAPIIEVPVGTVPGKVDRTPVSPSFAEYYLARLTEMIEYLKNQGEIEN